MLDTLGSIFHFMLALFPLILIMLFMKSKQVSESKFGKSDVALVLVFVAILSGVIWLNK